MWCVMRISSILTFYPKSKFIESKNKPKKVATIFTAKPYELPQIKIKSGYDAKNLKVQ